jgi:3-oxoacyl-[acyl-carrier protein] reductase
VAYELTGLEGKVAVVTGAGRMRSIGRPIALHLARAGCDVVVTGTGRDPSTFPAEEQAAGWRDIESVAEEVQALGRRALPIVTDVADAEAVDALADRVVAELGRVDVLVNNAAASRAGDRVPVVDLDLEAWRKVLSIGLDGALYMSRAFARRMLEAGVGGSIVNISSVGGKIGGASTAAYAAAKSGLHAVTSAMANELGASGIRVNAICPGIIDTSRLDDLHAAGRFDEVVRRNIPLARAGTGDDVAAAVVFLCSDQGAWVTGQQWNVDGGQLTIR